MSLILAIEPDDRQAAQLTDVIRTRVGAELVLARSTEQALLAIGNRVPDLVLIPTLLSPQEDAALAGALRVIATAGHVQMLTIPVLAEAPKPAATKRGVFSQFRRGRTTSRVPEGCDPAVFGEQIAAYLAEFALQRRVEDPESDDTESDQLEADQPEACYPEAHGPGIPLAVEASSPVVVAPVVNAPTMILETGVSVLIDDTSEAQADSVSAAAVVDEPIVILGESVAHVLEQAPQLVPESTITAAIGPWPVLHSASHQPQENDDVAVVPADEEVQALDESVALSALPSDAVSSEPIIEAFVPPTPEATPLLLSEPVGPQIIKPVAAAVVEPIAVVEPLEIDEPGVYELSLDEYVRDAASMIEFQPPAHVLDVTPAVTEESGNVASSLDEPAVDWAGTASTNWTDTAVLVTPAVSEAPAAVAVPACDESARNNTEVLDVEARQLVAVVEMKEAIEPVAVVATAAVEHAEVVTSVAVSDSVTTDSEAETAVHMQVDEPSHQALRVASVVIEGVVAGEAIAAEPAVRAADAVPVDIDPGFFDVPPDDSAVVIAPVARPQPRRHNWIELVESLRLDLEQRRLNASQVDREPPRQEPARVIEPARVVEPTVPRTRRAARSDSAKPPRRARSIERTRAPRPIQNEWGLFDPEQCGFAALLAKLDEITHAK